MEDSKTGLDGERTRLQGQIRDLERQQLQMSHQLQNTQEELQRSHATSTQMQNEEKELQARLASESEERERTQQELHQLKKQAGYSVIQKSLPLECILELLHSRDM